MKEVRSMTGICVEVKDEKRTAAYVTRYYIRTENDGTETIWELSYKIKNGQETVIQNMHYYDASRRPELDTPEKIHAKLVEMLHKIEESARADIDPDDSFKRTVNFFDLQDRPSNKRKAGEVFSAACTAYRYSFMMNHAAHAAKRQMRKEAARDKGQRPATARRAAKRAAIRAV